MREYDEGTLVDTKTEVEEENEDAALKIDDEFIDYFEKGVVPKIAITISSDKRASKVMITKFFTFLVVICIGRRNE